MTNNNKIWFKEPITSLAYTDTASMSCCTTGYSPTATRTPYEVWIDLLYLWIHRNKVTTPMQSTAVVDLKSIAPSWTSDIPSCKASCTTSYALQSSCITSCTPSCTACAAPSLHNIFLHISCTPSWKNPSCTASDHRQNAKVKRETHTRNEKKLPQMPKWNKKRETRNAKHETQQMPQSETRNA